MGLWVFFLGPVWAPVFILFMARVLVPLFIHRSFQVIFLQIFSAMVECVLKGAARDGLGDGDELRGGQFDFEVLPLQCSSPLGRSKAKKPFLDELLQPLGILFYTLFLLQIFGWPKDM